MTVIDLGEVGHDVEPVRPPRPPRPVGRPVRLALVALLALLGLAAAAPGSPPPVRVAVPAGPDPGQLVGDDLFVRSVPTAALMGRELTAVGLEDGRIRWRSPVPAGHHLVVLTEVGGDVAVTSDPGGEPVSAVLDHTDGRVRWRQPGVAVPTGDGGLLLEDAEPDRVAVRGVDVASGSPRWSAAIGPGAIGYRYDDRGITQIVLVAHDGRVEVRDRITGQLRRTFRIPPARGPMRETVQVVGDALLTDAGSGQVAAYHLDTGDLRWRRPLDPAAPFVQACGDAVCLGQRSGVRVLDLTTGRLRWADDRWSPLWLVDDRLLAVNSGGGPETFALLDPATGRVRSELGPWQIVGADTSGGRLVGRPLLVTRAVSGGRQLLGELDVGTGEVRPRDVLPGGWEFCTHRGRTVVCWRANGEQGVWRLGG
ncbi:outer membrane protein assembly factor BamB [Micromonospora palomenae]|uniref:Outer membrane protein assembly factor BamB n=1 Tax=Micromonospora palomenae TaxID=1461247 RepID=A0A561VJS1_9ACTN|nr:PQQ-binding-like beta-propeller repeat protein [Micromonospora palomenae]TWG11827.1 outer membrane protein assembly factor BamB [Micromonospora palomenae]